MRVHVNISPDCATPRRSREDNSRDTCKPTAAIQDRR